MKVYVLCPDGNNRGEIYVPGQGYLYLNLDDPILYDSASIRYGRHPSENFKILDNSDYRPIDIDDDLIMDVVDRLRRVDNVKRDITSLETERTRFLKAYRYKKESKCSDLEKLKESLSSPISMVKEKIDSD